MKDGTRAPRFTQIETLGVAKNYSLTLLRDCAPDFQREHVLETEGKLRQLRTEAHSVMRKHQVFLRHEKLLMELLQRKAET